MPTSAIVLAADDMESDVELFQMLFKRTGLTYPLRCYYSGEELVRAFTASPPALGSERPLACFLDIKMPGMTGHDVLRWIRGNPHYDSLPIIMLTSSAYPDDIAKARELGAQCYLEKFPKPDCLQRVLAWAAAPDATTKPFPLPENLLVNPPTKLL